MTASVETYLAVRRAVGFTLSNTEYLLRSFADSAGFHCELGRRRLIRWIDANHAGQSI